MKGWVVWLALFLSLGFNLGLVVSRLTDRASDPPADERPVELPVERPDPRPENPAAAQATDTTPRQVPRWLERIVVRVADELGLQGDERKRFFDLQRDFFRRTLQARRVQRRHEFEVRSLLASGTAERAEVEEALGRVVAAQREVETAFLDHYFAARALLDPQQMLRYRHFLGQLRRASQEMARRELGDDAPERPGRPGHPGRPQRPFR